MLKQLPSAKKLASLNRRQRKKLRVGEFQELVFKVSIRFRQPMEGPRQDAFVDEFIGLIESRRLAVGGGFGPLEATGIVSAGGRGSATDEDKQAVLNWLLRRPEVADAQTGALVDGWYGWEDDQ
ncbi:MAG: YggL family protein [Pseudomonadales bacterium]|jgi:uncharacterized protein YggL (DUF469 family)|nr:YggL family protein [Pseudomonadales bacterium]